MNLQSDNAKVSPKKTQGMHLDPAFEKAVTFPRLPRQQLEGSKYLHGGHDDDDDDGDDDDWVGLKVTIPSSK